MAKIIRHQFFKLEGGEGEEIRLRKWSAGKLFLIIREFWDLLESSLDGVDLKQLDEVLLVKKLVKTFIGSEDLATSLIIKSIDRPEGLKKDAVLEWDAVDFLCILTKIIEMNINEELVKNFQRLLKSFSLMRGKKKEAKKEAKKTESLVSSNA